MQAGEGSGPLVAVFTKNRTNPAYDGARAGADRVAARFGGRVRHFVPTVPDDVDQQIALVDAALAERPDAVVMIPAHPTALLPALAKIHAAGIPVVTAVARAEDPQVLCHVGADDEAVGFAVSAHLFDRLGGRGDVLLVGGHPNSSTTHDRERGFRRAVAANPGIRVAGVVRGDYQRDSGRAAMAAVLADGVPFDAVVAANDQSALGALDALAAAGRRAPVVGVNAIPAAVKAIQAGDLLATVAFDAMSIASIAAEAVLRHLGGQALPHEIMLPVTVVDAGNCAAWDLPYERRGTPAWETVVIA
ncbi:MAG: sugar ABC transporter substrate-binding protein [Alphaproteobacteria bacterium]